MVLVWTLRKPFSSACVCPQRGCDEPDTTFSRALAICAGRRPLSHQLVTWTGSGRVGGGNSRRAGVSWNGPRSAALPLFTVEEGFLRRGPQIHSLETLDKLLTCFSPHHSSLQRPGARRGSESLSSSCLSLRAECHLPF